jgi:aspartyl protease family protein
MKFGSFFVLTLAAGALVGWFAPGGSERKPAVAEEAEAAATEDRLEIVRREQWLAGEVVLPQAGDGHYYAEVSSDSGTVTMLVDTGASIVALTDGDAAMLGVDWRESDVRAVARGASGAVYGAPVMLERIEVGGIEARGVQAVVVPEGLDVSLLGQSFLTTVDQVEVNGDRMVLRD